MLDILLNFSYFLQSFESAQELLATKEVTIIGVLLFIITTLLSGLIYLYRKNEGLSGKRLEDHKEFTKEILAVAGKTEDTVRQVNEILKIIQRDAR